MTTEYALYLESGPKMKTTMVHVFDLLGCIANGPTTEAALEATPGEIREFLRFLQRHGENVDPDAPFTTKIAAHVMEGSWIGQGDPAPGFAPDFEPLTPEDESAYRRRFQWLGEEIVALIGEVPEDELSAKPSKGRVLRDIVTHVANAEPEYFRASGIGKPEGVKEALQAIEGAQAGELAARARGLLAAPRHPARTHHARNPHRPGPARRKAVDSPPRFPPRARAPVGAPPRNAAAVGLRPCLTSGSRVARNIRLSRIYEPPSEGTATACSPPATGRAASPRCGRRIPDKPRRPASYSANFERRSELVEFGERYKEDIGDALQAELTRLARLASPRP